MSDIHHPGQITVTKRLVISVPALADIADICALWADPVVTHHMGGPRDPDRIRSMLLEDIDNGIGPLDLWCVRERHSGAFVGHCGLTPKNIDGVDEVELIYVLTVAMTGHGYAAEAADALRTHAFRDLGLPRLTALIDPANEASARVAVRAGLRWEKDVIRSGNRLMHLYSCESDSKAR